MQIPEKTTSQDMRDVLLQLSQEVKELRQEVRQLGQLVQKPRNPGPPNFTASDRMIQGAIWVIIAAAMVSVVSNVSAVILQGLAGHSL
jgi:hypothetical protein